MTDSPACWAPDALGESRTTHDHFEGRCIVDPMADDFRGRLDAYRSGGWPAWQAVALQQRDEVAP